MNVTEFELPPRQGWICPKCGSVWAPWQAQCLNCTSSRTTFAVSTLLKDDTLQSWLDTLIAIQASEPRPTQMDIDDAYFEYGKKQQEDNDVCITPNSESGRTEQ